MVIQLVILGRFDIERSSIERSELTTTANRALAVDGGGSRYLLSEV